MATTNKLVLIAIAGGDWWTDDYSLRPIGVLACPTIELSEVVSDTKHINEDNNDQDWVVVQ